MHVEGPPVGQRANIRIDHTAGTPDNATWPAGVYFPSLRLVGGQLVLNGLAASSFTLPFRSMSVLDQRSFVTANTTNVTLQIGDPTDRQRSVSVLQGSFRLTNFAQLQLLLFGRFTVPANAQLAFGVDTSLTGVIDSGRITLIGQFGQSEFDCGNITVSSGAVVTLTSSVKFALDVPTIPSLVPSIRFFGTGTVILDRLNTTLMNPVIFQELSFLRTSSASVPISVYCCLVMCC
jgi:hypothetical protein